MSFISKKLSVIKPSPTLAVTRKAGELKRAGKDVISLGAGEPDFDTPVHIKEFAKKAIDNGQTKYTDVDGTPELKKAIVEKFKRENHLEYQTNQITVGTGGKQVIYNAFMATLNAEDEVIIPAPYWVSYPDMVLLAGGKPVIVPTLAKNNFKLKAKELEKAITKNTKWLILNSPSNPTGATYTYDELKEIANLLLAHPQVHILSDDIYEHIIYDNFKFYTIAQFDKKLFERTITVNGVSKAYAMTGWRIGYAGAYNTDLIKAISVIQSQSTSNPSSVSQAASVGALNGDSSFLKDRNKVFQKRRDFMVEGLNSIKGISCNKPEGAFYVFPACDKLFGKKTPSGKVIKDDNDFCEFLLDEALLAVVSGTAFGMNGFFRISYATSDEILKKALVRISEAVGKLA